MSLNLLSGKSSSKIPSHSTYKRRLFKLQYWKVSKTLQGKQSRIVIREVKHDDYGEWQDEISFFHNEEKLLVMLLGISRIFSKE